MNITTVFKIGEATHRDFDPNAWRLRYDAIVMNIKYVRVTSRLGWKA